jgi:hypothetical protein
MRRKKIPHFRGEIRKLYVLPLCFTVYAVYRYRQKLPCTAQREELQIDWSANKARGVTRGVRKGLCAGDSAIGGQRQQCRSLLTPPSERYRAQTRIQTARRVRNSRYTSGEQQQPTCAATSDPQRAHTAMRVQGCAAQCTSSSVLNSACRPTLSTCVRLPTLLHTCTCLREKKAITTS